MEKSGILKNLGCFFGWVQLHQPWR